MKYMTIFSHILALLYQTSLPFVCQKTCRGDVRQTEEGARGALRPAPARHLRLPREEGARGEGLGDCAEGQELICRKTSPQIRP